MFVGTETGSATARCDWLGRPVGLGARSGIEYSALLRIERIAEGLAGLERWGSGGGDLDAFPGTGIAPPTIRTFLGCEPPESGNGDGFPLRQGVADGGEDGSDNAVRRSLRQGRPVDDVRSEVGLVHGTSPCSAIVHRCWTRVLIRVPSHRKPRNLRRGSGIAATPAHGYGEPVSREPARRGIARVAPWGGDIPAGTPIGVGVGAAARGECARALPGRGSVRGPEGGLAHDGLELAERSQVFGRAPGDEAGPVAEAPEPDRQGLEEPARQAVEEGEREPGEVGAVGHQEEPGGARAQDGPHARRHGLAQSFEERVERGAAVAG